MGHVLYGVVKQTCGLNSAIGWGHWLDGACSVWGGKADQQDESVEKNDGEMMALTVSAEVAPQQSGS